MRIDRNEFIEELLLRENIQKAISHIEKKKSNANKAIRIEESKLRKVISRLLKEESEGPTPHSSTGINVLEDLLKKIVPVLETDYKQLTSDPEQRNSYRSHIVNAIQNALAPSKMMAGSTEDLNEVVEFEVSDDEGGDVESEELDDGQFIDISGNEGAQDDFGIQGQDQTGRNFAEKTFQKVETQILDAYALLSADEDREVFYDYLITNVKLYFDKFEDELASVLPEPTNPEYEDEKGEQEADNEEGLEASEEGSEGEESLEGEEDEDLGGDEEIEL